MFFDISSSAVRFCGRWDTTGDRAITTAPGGMIEIAFSGEWAVMHFDIDMNMEPYPHLWISVDDGAKIEAPVSRVLRVEAKGEGEHYIKVIYKSAVEIQHRWYQPLIGKLCFLGFDAEKEGTLPEDNRKVIEFIGDSITEGVLIDAFYDFDKANDQMNRPYQDDSTATYAYLTAMKLGMRPHIMGYGAVGVTKGGCGSVPKAGESYPYNFCGSEAACSGAEVIVINHGANDRGHTAEEYTKEYYDFLLLVRKKNRASKIVVLSAFCGVYPKELKATVESFNKENNDNIFFIDSAGWIPDDPLHPLRDGHKIVSEHLYEELKKIL